MALRFAILTVSDRSARGERPDASGPALEQAILERGWQVVLSGIVSDEVVQIQDYLREWADAGQADVILTTGGTGFAARDVTPEATGAVVERAEDGPRRAAHLPSEEA